MLLDRLAKAWSIRLGGEACLSKVGEGKRGETPVGLACPQTFMNSSGEAVACLMKRWQVAPSDVLVVFDDVALPLGMIRIRGQGSSGGHLGLASVAQEAGTEELPRLRIGIGPAEKPEGDLAEFVLGRFTAAEQAKLEGALELAEQACGMWVEGRLPDAMNRFNRKATEEKERE